MKIFETKYKVNFVDKNNVLVGFDTRQQCCEDAGYTITKKLGVCADGKDINTDGFVFDTKFFEDEWKADSCDSMVENAAIFRLTNGDEELYLILYNHHNGYYSHGFEFKSDHEIFREGYL